MKTCTNCEQQKPITNFRPNKSDEDGRSNNCRSCEKKARKEAGLCVFCYKPQKPGYVQCENCLEQNRNAERKRIQKRKQIILEQYGTNCAFCGESEEIFLTIDHINNDGAKHRKAIGNGKNHHGSGSGSNIHKWLIKNNFPPGFQILCYNCNCTKTRHGEKVVKEAIARSQTTLKKELLRKLLQAIKEKRITV